MTAQQVLTYQRAWTHLVALNSGLVTAPVSMLLVILMLIFVVTSYSYEAVDRLVSGYGSVSWLSIEECRPTRRCVSETWSLNLFIVKLVVRNIALKAREKISRSLGARL